VSQRDCRTLRRQHPPSRTPHVRYSLAAGLPAVKTASKRGGELGVAVPDEEVHGSVVRHDQQAAHRRGRGRQDTPPPRSVDDLGCGGREAGLTVHELECHHARPHAQHPSIAASSCCCATSRQRSPRYSGMTNARPCFFRSRVVRSAFEGVCDLAESTRGHHPRPADPPGVLLRHRPRRDAPVIGARPNYRHPSGSDQTGCPPDLPDDPAAP
jgi:hypothetical protein